MYLMTNVYTVQNALWPIPLGDIHKGKILRQPIKPCYITGFSLQSRDINFSCITMVIPSGCISMTRPLDTIIYHINLIADWVGQCIQHWYIIGNIFTPQTKGTLEDT